MGNIFVLRHLILPEFSDRAPLRQRKKRLTSIPGPGMTEIYTGPLTRYGMCVVVAGVTYSLRAEN